MVAQEYISQGFQLPFPLVVLLLGGLATPLVGLLAERVGMRRLREAWMVIVATGTLGSVYFLYWQLAATAKGVMVIAVWGQNPPLAGCFEIDMLSIFMTGSIAFLGLLVSIYSVSYMEKETRLTEFYTLVIFMLAGMTGVSMAGDLFTLFVFWELMGLSSYVLVAFLKRTWGPIEAGFKYLVMSATAGAFLILSMAIIYGMTGTLNFAALADSLRGAASSPWILTLFSTLVVGFGVKSAIVPLHTWLPDAHTEAPTAGSMILAGVLLKLGAYGFLRLVLPLYPAESHKYAGALAFLATMIT